MTTTRRSFLQSMLAAPLVAGNALAAKQPPNIVFFFVDDMGWQDTSVPFFKETTPLNRKYHTPAMETLAQTGMKFTQAYAHCVCSPSRVSLMTGLNPARHRVTNWTLRKNATNDAKHPTLDLPQWNVNGLSPVEGIERTICAKPLPMLLKEAGYHTIHCGKAHFGAVDTPGADPTNLGFDVNIAGHAAGGPGSFLGEQNFSAVWRNADPIWDVPGLEEYHGEDVFLTEALTREALKAANQAVDSGAPFFLYMSHYAVHVPFAKDKRFYQKYIDRGLDETEAMYAAMVEGMDKSLQDILAFLKKRDIEDNTVVLFISDNGGLSAHGRGGEPHTHNAPLSSGKGSAREGGVRVPMMVRWPGVTEPGSQSSQPVIIEDCFQTLLDIAGTDANAPTEQTLDGVAFTPVLRGEELNQDDRAFVWHFPNNWGPSGPGIGPHSAIRQGRWKLIYYHADSSIELFDLETDIRETYNLCEQKPEIAKRLTKRLSDDLREVDAQMPTVRATGKRVPWPDKAF